MKDITIKILIFLLIICGQVLAKTYKQDELIGLTPMHAAPKKVAKKKLELKKNKKGKYIVGWDLFDAYPGNPLLKKALNKQTVIRGYMIPLEYTTKAVKEFLLVPYIPSCMHFPPPPEKQIINVKIVGKGMSPSYHPVEVHGKLKIDKSWKKSEDPYFLKGKFKMTAERIMELEY